MTGMVERIQAAGFADELRVNADVYAHGAIKWEDFDKTAKRLWNEADNLGLKEDVLAILRNDAE